MPSAASVVGREFAGDVVLAACDPHERMPPERGGGEVGEELPERIARGEVRQLVGEHHVLLRGGEAGGEVAGHDHAGSQPTEGGGGAEAFAGEHTHAAAQAESRGEGGDAFAQRLGGGDEVSQPQPREAGMLPRGAHEEGDDAGEPEEGRSG